VQLVVLDQAVDEPAVACIDADQATNAHVIYLSERQRLAAVAPAQQVAPEQGAGCSMHDLNPRVI